MKILVTGGAGFIGSHLVDLLIKNNHEVIIIDNLSTGNIKNINPRARFYNIDLRNYKRIESIFEKEKPEIIYHTAAQINVRKSTEFPILDAEINILSGINLLELSIKHNIKHFIFSSTGGAIYGNAKKIPTPENYSKFPLSPYGCGKLCFEKYLVLYKNLHNLKFTCLRYSNVYGPRQNPEGEAGVISIFFQDMFSNKPPKVFGGIQTRDFVYVEDIVKANLLALNDSNSNFYNVGTGIPTDIIEIFSRINKYFKNKFYPEYYEIKKGEQKTSCLDISKIKLNLNFQPQTPLEQGLDKTYAWFVKNQANSGL